MISRKKIAALLLLASTGAALPGELTGQAWLPKLKEMIPSYGISLINDANLTRKIRTETARVLKIEDVNSKPMQEKDLTAAAR